MKKHLKAITVIISLVLVIGAIAVSVSASFGNAENGTVYPISCRFYTGTPGSAAEMADDTNYTDAVTLEVGDTLSGIYNGAPDVHNGFLGTYYLKDAPFLGWSSDPNAKKAHETLTYELALENQGKTLKLYPVYSIESSTLPYTAIVVKEDGTVDTSRSISNTEWWNTQLGKFDVKAGETFILQKDGAIIQSALDKVWKNASPVDGKSINIDLNGHVLILDGTYHQSVPAKRTFSTIEAGHSVNVYSSNPGGKISSFGINIPESKKQSTTKNYTEGSSDIPPEGTTLIGNIKTVITYGESILNDDGTKTIPVTTQTYTLNASGGVLFSVKGGDAGVKTSLCIGTVEINGKTIPGSNLTLEGCDIIDASSVSEDCLINIDGITAIATSVDYPAMFITRTFNGQINIKNSLIINTINNNIVCGHKNGATMSGNTVTANNSKAKISFDGCAIIVKNTGGNIVADTYSGESITFTDCTTNGAMNKAYNTNVKVILGVGNKYASTNAEFVSGVSNKTYGQPMTLLNGNSSINTYYLTVSTTYDWDGNGAQMLPYSRNDFLIAAKGSSEAANADFVLPNLAYTSLSDCVTVTYKGLGTNSDIVQNFEPGADLIEAPEIPDYELTAIKLVHTGKFDKEIPKTVTENIEITPLYEVKSNIEGFASTAEIQSDFCVNFYIPAEYEEYITGIEVDGIDAITSSVAIDGKAHIRVTACRNPWEAAKETVLTLSITEGEYETKISETVSIISYASKIISYSVYPEEKKNLVYYMLAYTSAASEYFGKGERDAVDEMLKGITLGDYSTENDSDCTLISNVFSSVAVDVKGGNMAYIFTVNPKYSGEFKVTLGEKIYTERDISDGKLRVNGVKFYEFAKDLLIEADGISGGKYNLAAYLESHKAINDVASAECISLVEPLYNYAKSAGEYIVSDAHEHFDENRDDNCDYCGKFVNPVEVLPPDKEIYSQKQSILLMGQSNMAGRGDVNAVEAINNDRIFMQRDGAWVKMTEPIHYDRSFAGVGLAASFADAFVKTFDVDVGLVPCAVGGTSIDEWAVGGELYNDTVERAKAAMKDSEIAAILWHQGCADQGKYQGYAEKFKAIMDALMEELGLDPDKIIIISGELGTFRTGDITNIHNEFYRIGDYYENYAVTSSEGLTAQDVTTHFDAQSLRIFGYRYFANFYQCLTGKIFTDYSEDPTTYLKEKDSSESDNTNTPPEAPEGYLSVEDYSNFAVGYAYKIHGGHGKVANVFNDAYGKHISLQGASNSPHTNVDAPVGMKKDFVIEADYRISETFTAGADIMKPIASYNGAEKSMTSIWVGNDGVLYDADKKTELGVSLSSMEWIRIAVVYHIEDMTRDIYIDGQLLKAGLSIPDFSEYDVYALRLVHFKSNTGTSNYIYVDNFECYYGTELK